MPCSTRASPVSRPWGKHMMRSPSLTPPGAAGGCGEIPINELGAPIPVDVKRWWCPTHLHLASEGDMAPRPSRLRIMPGGAIVEVDEAPEAREAAAAASRSAQFEAQQADRRLEAEQRAAAQRALDEQF